MSGKRVMIVVTSVGEYESVGYRTGLWLGELTHFWDYLHEAGGTATIASIAGGPVPLDPESLTQDVLEELGTRKRYADRASWTYWTPPSPSQTWPPTTTTPSTSRAGTA